MVIQQVSNSFLRSSIKKKIIKLYCSFVSHVIEEDRRGYMLNQLLTSGFESSSSILFGSFVAAVLRVNLLIFNLLLLSVTFYANACLYFQK